MPRRVLTGKVVSDKMEKTVVVRIDRRVMHPLYKKIITRSKKYAAHDETDSLSIGDTVRIRECRPKSRNKRFEVIEKVGV
ncbi:MAG: 30S ribosomal protein S17 [Alphaproteobacteria bacterium]|nr:30S ribosomal protein S17 [Alphaproteobacteria bacterium]MCZ6509198.1 30S ribosomal protein S17 [Alphaproteobacteria bacterium]MCZ6586463.1 30S ribosomal protein S17 [Alphaproteobacteria bacterium]MCZ6591827.1 30S ribosomal protein S17 [Alphaproteobacteria bacterium]MCZ6840880.1 30S ribosomal protein S17 [Alphaproteobacteria bacterium]